MAKKSRKKTKGTNQETERTEKKGAGKLLTEIIQESLKPDANLIILDGKIKELESSGEDYLPLLKKKLGQGKYPEQKVIFDLLARNKSKKATNFLKKILKEDEISVKILHQALLQLQKWAEPVDEILLKVFKEGEEVLDAIERYSEFGGILDEGAEHSIIEKFAPLPKNIKFAVIKQVLDEYPKAFPLALELIKKEGEPDDRTINLLAVNAGLEVGELFIVLFKETKDKNLRRLLKKHLFQMKSKGLEIVIPEIEEDEPIKISKPEEPQANVYITGMDYTGDRLIFLSKSVAGMGVVFFQITLSDQEGIKNFSAFDLNRRCRRGRQDRQRQGQSQADARIYCQGRQYRIWRLLGALDRFPLRRTIVRLPTGNGPQCLVWPEHRPWNC